MNYGNSVFINCPLDEKYINDLLKPILYFLVRNNYIPRLSMEISDSGQLRLDKITTIIKECKFSIHDLSIVKCKKKNEYARMNMPFELGVDYGIRKSGISPYDKKKFLILEEVKYDYQKALSDISGFDIKAHKNSTEKVFECLHSWASETLKIKNQDPPLKIFYEFNDFNTSLFEDKLKELGSEKLAKNHIEKMSIPEYISEIKCKI